MFFSQNKTNIDNRKAIDNKLYYLKLELKKKWIGYVFIAPFMSLFILFTVIPVLVSIFLSFTYYNALEAPKFIGVMNYFRLFLQDDVFIISVKNTLLFAVVTGPISYIASLLFAWFINELNPRIRSILTIMFYAPSISGGAYAIFTILFSGDRYGLINSLLTRTGLMFEPVNWMQNPKYIMLIIILVSLWLSLGTSFLAFIAGLQSVDKSLYEAGAVDGIKTRWHELWYITLPSMRPQLMFGAVMSITASFAVSDVSVSLAGLPSVEYAGHTIVTHLMDYGGIRFEMGYASAIATLLFLIMIGANKLVNTLLRRVGG